MQKDNAGALFKNDRRETDKHPLYKGSAMIDGREFWVSSWINESQKGEKYMSLKFEPKQPNRDTSQADDFTQDRREERARQSAPDGRDSLNDDPLPF